MLAPNRAPLRMCSFAHPRAPREGAPGSSLWGCTARAPTMRPAWTLTGRNSPGLGQPTATPHAHATLATRPRPCSHNGLRRPPSPPSTTEQAQDRRAERLLRPHASRATPMAPWHKKRNFSVACGRPFPPQAAFSGRQVMMTSRVRASRTLRRRGPPRANHSGHRFRQLARGNSGAFGAHNGSVESVWPANHPRSLAEVGGGFAWVDN